MDLGVNETTFRKVMDARMQEFDGGKSLLVVVVVVVVLMVVERWRR